ncbi:MAG: saccharopine dehydrogenase NADP-binding domain-containing protein [Chitinophagales bacterium]|nr:saccharopine dehydrogenase NADP-binding domain-containing protein [Chitinophagales bacterium]MDW8418969.1 saccharopine dehydrogenase NADP-binding domain-containing protein [Chitinophagales bacterium]
MYLFYIRPTNTPPVRPEDTWLLYGCYGYTGELIARHAVECGMRPTLAGRDANRVAKLAGELNLPYLVFPLNDADAIAERIAGFKCVLHCAGPFIHTAPPMLRACLKSKVHYLDITGEYQIFEDVFALDKQARDAGIMLLPGVGFDVVPSDCLAAHLKDALPSALMLELVIMSLGGGISRGTALTIVENLGMGTVIRRRGKLRTVEQGEITRAIEYNKKSYNAVAITWGDVSTAYRSTSIPNITVYSVLPPRVIRTLKLSNFINFVLRSAWFKKLLRTRITSRPPGPDANKRQSARSAIWGEVSNNLGITKQMLLTLPEGYTLTYLTAVAIVNEVLKGNFITGAQTPSLVYGKDFILRFKGVQLEDLSQNFQKPLTSAKAVSRSS